MGIIASHTTQNTPEWRLLHPTSDNEETRRANIRDWLYEIGLKTIKVEHETGDGPADIFLPNQRIIIEVKKKGHAEPDNTAYGVRSGETPLQQLGRYMKSVLKYGIQAEFDNEGNIQNADPTMKWLGVITDSQIWHMFEYQDIGKFEYIIGWNSTSLNIANIKNLAKKITSRHTGYKEWAEEDPTELFREHREALMELYNKKNDERDVITQRELWYRQLKISGNQPDEDHINELFVLHTLMIVASTIISLMYGNTEAKYGFASWAKNSKWMFDFKRAIEKRDWRQQTGDLLRRAYMGLVPKEHRHIYGEYYTPDWLAEKLCMDVIDNDYIEEWIRKYNSNRMSSVNHDYKTIKELGGIMDPACGSGTFLYHAIRHIINSASVKNATMTTNQITDMATEMIYGIDIHPVAVAMARANVLRALPCKPNRSLHIYQGDSLQVDRKIGGEQLTLDVSGSNIFRITSRENIDVKFPVAFIETRDFEDRIHRFVNAAVSKHRFPPGVDNEIDDSVKPMLHEAFKTLTDICYNEGNDVWAWYMINQVGIYMLKGHISRMVTNPPWVRMSNIQDKPRKNEMEQLAKDLKLWVGGKNATGFNIAALFVIQCRRLYGIHDNIKSAWVLPDAAMKGGNWAKYIKQANVSAIYDLGNLPFPKHSAACANIFGIKKQKPVRLVLNKSEPLPRHNESWKTVSEKTQFDYIKQHYIKQSEWIEGKRTIARNGATIFPQCLVVLDDYTEDSNGIISGSTRKGRQGIWNGKTFLIQVPKSCIKQVLFNSEGLLPYVINKPRNVILPIDNNGQFLKNRISIEWWLNACDKYRFNKGLGKNTPKTLEERLDHDDALTNQFPMKKHTVIYNKSGSNLYAARLIPQFIIENTLYRVTTKSKNEALFLIAILNADCMQDRYRATKKSDRHFDTHFWYEIPIPRFDKNNRYHIELTKLAKRAEQIAAMVEPSYTKIKQALHDDGVSHNIDKIVRKVITDAEKKSDPHSVSIAD